MTEMPRIGKKEVFIVVGFSDKTPDALFYCMIPPKKILTSNHFLPYFGISDCVDMVCVRAGVLEQL